MQQHTLSSPWSRQKILHAFIELHSSTESNLEKFNFLTIQQKKKKINED